MVRFTRNGSSGRGWKTDPTVLTMIVRPVLLETRTVSGFPSQRTETATLGAASAGRGETPGTSLERAKANADTPAHAATETTDQDSHPRYLLLRQTQSENVATVRVCGRVGRKIRPLLAFRSVPRERNAGMFDAGDGSRCR